MFEENYSFLARAVGKLGFEDTLNGPLRTKMEEGQPSFELKAKVNHGKDNMIHELQFERKKESGYYFLQSQNVTLINENKEELKQRFPFFNQTGFNNDETYNLMMGRPVRNRISKEGQEIIRWTYLDLKAPRNDKGNIVFRNPREADLNFSLAKAVNNLPLQNIGQEEKENILKGLQQGNLMEVTLRLNGRLEKVHLQADPIYNRVLVFNSQMEKITLSNSKIQVLEEEKKELPDTTKKLMEKINDPKKEKELKQKIG